MKLIEIEPSRDPEKKRSNWQERDMGSILCRNDSVLSLFPNENTVYSEVETESIH